MFDRIRSLGTPADGDGEARDPKLLVLGGLLGVVLLIALGYFVLLPALGSGDDSTEASAVVTHHATATSSASASASPTASASASAAATGDSSRDPFTPLSAEAVSSSSTASSTTGTSSSTTASASPSASASTSTSSSTSTDSGSTGSSSTTSGGSASADTSSSSSSASATAPVQLMSVDGSTANVQVDSTSYTVRTGSEFADGYTCVEVGSESVSIQHGSKTAKLVLGELQTF